MIITNKDSGSFLPSRIPGVEGVGVGATLLVGIRIPLYRHSIRLYSKTKL